MNLLNRPGLAEVIRGVNIGKRVMVLELSRPDDQLFNAGPAWDVKPLQVMRIEIIKFDCFGIVARGTFENTMDVCVMCDCAMRPIEPDAESVRDLEEVSA